MLPSECRYSKLRWSLTIAGLVLNVVDIGTDIGLALQYFQDHHFVWAVMTLIFVLAGLVATQIFSYAWYEDDMNNVLLNPDGETTLEGTANYGLLALHVFGLGLFTRYFNLLKDGYHELWPETSAYTIEEQNGVHQMLFGLATDLSMLKLFEAFLESVPQLLLQVYIVLGHDECSVMQYISISFSFFNIAWALVDYRRCLRRSLSAVREMPSGLPTVVYLLYKLFTITPRILSYALLLSLSLYTAVALCIIWLLGTIWAHFLRTNFCMRRSTEWVYRAIAGVILTFTFFNVKGRDTGVPMSLYYLFHSFLNVVAPLLCATLRPEWQTTRCFWPVTAVIIVGTGIGLVCLMAYYALLHPRGGRREADEVDGLENEPESRLRIKIFLQP